MSRSPLTVADVVRRCPLVAALAVSGHACHELLIVDEGDVSEERDGAAASKRRGDSAVMSDDDVAVLSPRERETLSRWHRAQYRLVSLPGHLD